MKLKIFSVCNIIFCISYIFPSKTVLWDVGGVLFQPNTTAIVTNIIGISNPLKYYMGSLFHGIIPQGLQAQTYNIMYQQGGYQQVAEHIKVRDNRGQELPQIMVDWLNGKQTSKEILQHITEHIAQLDQTGYFVNNAHKATIESIAYMMFNPQQLAYNLQPIPQWCALLQASVQAGNQNIIISNFDIESFDYLFNSPHGKIVFAGIDRNDCVISAECAVSKPRPEIFQYALKKYNLNPEECIFIDDQWENIATAREIKIGTVYVPTYNFENVYEALINLKSIV